MKKGLRSSLLLILLLIAPALTFATHLIGGAITYEYLSTNGSGEQVYRVTFKTYLDCNSPFWGGAFPEASLGLGFYEGPSNAANNLSLTDSLTVFLVDSQSIDPDLPAGCAISIPTCIYEITYEGTIALPVSFSGYHIFYDRCCRNSGTINLDDPGSQGMGFTAWIGPTLLLNSSPAFTNPPAPYVCVGDTTSILNTAIDPEGDQLIFSFTDPYRGNTGDGNGGNPPPDLGIQDPLLLPIAQVTWNPNNYGTNSLFGANGYQYINAFTGYSEYMSPIQGPHVVAVQINEYRNGNLIGITRRDIQLLVDNCLPNDAPELVSFTSDEPLITIEEGDSLCFPITYFDQNGDSVPQIQISGTVFDGSVVNPPATLTPAQAGSNTISTTFCWPTDCGQAQVLDYLFNVSVPDNGCPPKIENTVFRIHVDAFAGPTTIVGQTQVCSGLGNITYTTDTLAGATYFWTATGGTIIQDDSTETIVVDWGNGPIGQVTVYAESPNGCSSNTLAQTISFTTVFADAGPNQAICLGDSVQIGGSPSAFAGTTVAWTPATGLDDPTSQNPMASPDTTTTYYLEVTDPANNCISIDSMVVTVPDELMQASPDGGVCVGDSITMIASGAVTYAWTPAFSLTDSTSATPTAFPTVPTLYIVNMTNAGGCTEVDSVFVDAWLILPVDAGFDTTYCDGGSVILGGNPTTPAFASFSWSPSTALDDTATANPLASPTPGVYTYTVLATDTNGCFNSDDVQVTVNALPTANAGTDVAICDGDTTQLLATGALNYNWSPTDSLSGSTIDNPLAWPTTTTTYIVTATDANGCIDVDDVMVTVNQLPAANAGGDAGLCAGDTLQLNATGGVNYSWAPPVNISATNINNPQVWPAAGTTYIVTVTDANNCTASDSIAVSVNNLPIVDAGPDSTICFGDSLVIGGTPTGPAGSTYSWTSAGIISSNTAANPVATPTSTASYIVEVTDSNTCVALDTAIVTVISLPIVDAGTDTALCVGDTVQLSGTGAGTPLWSHGSSLSSNGILNPFAFPTDTTNYVLAITDANNCVGRDTVEVIVWLLPDPIAAPVIDLCIGDTTNLNASGAATYLWTPATNLSDPTIPNSQAWPTDTTTYTVIATDTNGCVATDSVTIVVNPLPIINAGLDTAICFGDTIVTGGSPTGPALSTYAWTPAFSMVDSAVANPSVFPTVTTDYIVAVTDSNTCIEYDTARVVVIPLPAVDAGPDDAICIGDTTQLAGSGAGTPSWDNGGTLSSTNGFTPDAFPTDTTDYILTITDVNTCQNSDTMTVIVWLLPDPIAAPVVEICIFDTLQLDASGAVSYLWSPTDSLSNPNIADPLAWPIDTTTYTVQVTDTNSCSNFDSVTVVVNPLPIITAGPNEIICINDSVQIGGSPTGPALATYLWSPTTAMDNSLAANPMVAPNNTLMYYLTVTDSNACVQFDSAQVLVNPLPIIDAGLDTFICLNDSAQLMATGGISYVWSPATGIANTNSANPMAAPTDSTTYLVTGTDANTCVNSDSVTIGVWLLPTANAGPDLWLCPGDEITANASGGLTYLWTPATGLSDPTIPNPVIVLADTTEYQLFITDTNTCTDIDSLTLIVNGIVPTDAGLMQTICFGDSVAIGGSPSAPDSSLYFWSPALGLSDSTAGNPMASPPLSQWYYVAVTNDTCQGLDSVQVIVNQLPPADAGQDIAICFGDTVQLSASGGLNYIWSPDTALSDALVVDPFAFPSDTITYVVQVVDGNACVDTDTITVTVNPLPIVDAGTDQTICIGDSILIGGAATGPPLATYAWSPNTNLDYDTVANPIAFPTADQAYVVIVTDSNTCVESDAMTVFVNILPTVDAGSDVEICVFDDTQLQATGATNYVWTPDSALSNDSIAGPLADPQGTTLYFVTGTDNNGCINMDSVLVTVHPLPPVSAGPNVEICIGLSTQLQASGADSFVWSPPTGLSSTTIADPVADPVITAAYTVTGTDTNTCVNTDIVIVTVNPLPIVEAGTDTISCSDDPVVLGGSPTGPAGATYVWTPAANVNDPSLANPTATPGATTQFLVVVTDTNGCIESDSTTASIFSVGSVADNAVCERDSVSIGVTTLSGVMPYTYSWTPTQGVSDPTVASPTVSPAASTVYSVMVTDANGCEETTTADITVDLRPLATFEVEVDPSCDGLEVDFINITDQADSYIWRFADGSEETTMDVTRNYNYSDALDLQLVALNTATGCSDSTNMTDGFQALSAYFDFSVPNVMTPNGDGMNDVFRTGFTGELDACTQLTIFNRWGTQVYPEANSTAVEWDGTINNGNQAPAGVYFYVIEVAELPTLQGTVTLMR